MNNKNTRILERNLSKIMQEEKGQVSDLFTIDYDTLYVFAPYEAKSVMKTKIGFSTGIIEESTSEGCLNYLFVKEKKQPAICTVCRAILVIVSICSRENTAGRNLNRWYMK
ncbi:MAG: hypothetical protein GX234_08005 [Clostridiales bacterium]|nr:hypothetical protein [Clostridiales bacterium]